MEETVQPFRGRIGIIGAGALGAYYGACLSRAGHDVHFLMRGDYEAVRARGLEVRSVGGDFRIHPPVYPSAEALGRCDLVVVGLKTTDNGSLPGLLGPTADAGTVVLTLQNGLGNEDAIARVLAGIASDDGSVDARALPTAHRVVGGSAFLCSNRIAPGVINHTDHGFIRLAEFTGPARPRTHAIAELFRSAGVKCHVLDSLAEVRWSKLIWNVPFNGLGVAAWRADSAAVLADPALCGVARSLMSEVIAAARADGVELDESAADASMERTASMGAYRSSMQIDHECGRPLEVEAILGEPLRRAERASIAVPAMRMLYALVRRADELTRAQK